MRWFGDLFPRWDLCEPIEGGVKFKPGGVIEDLEVGRIYWYWPAVTRVYKIDTKRQTLTFGQRLTTKDGRSIQFNTVIVFTIDDVRKALVETKDFEDTVGEVAQKLTVQPMMGREFEDICEDIADSNKMRNEVTRGARSLLRDFGCNVLDGYVSDFTETEVFSHDGDGMVFGHGDEE
jgi:regulator of protease activity HflC (stomatin/prohibitin superfamily)